MSLQERLERKEVTFEELLKIYDVSVALELASAYRLPQSKG